jgi:hypothetical protein
VWLRVAAATVSTLPSFLAVSFANALHRCTAHFPCLRDSVIGFALMGEQEVIASCHHSGRVLPNFEKVPSWLVARQHKLEANQRYALRRGYL